MSWRYGQVLVDIEEDGEKVFTIFEVYFDESGTPNGFCTARFSDAEDLRLALGSIEKYSPIESFYEKGRFTWNSTTRDYDYEELSSTDKASGA
tara:strand:+ start:55 stop:333 length:279 start_codon:yes stop_codon:yes gene_type:complete